MSVILNTEREQAEIKQKVFLNREPKKMSGVDLAS